MAKINVILLAVVIMVLCAGCPQQQQQGGAVCGNSICDTAEDSTTCPQDCKTSTGTGGTGTSTQSSGKMVAPELSVTIDKTSLPKKLQPNDQAIIIIHLKNKAKMTTDEEENTRLTIRNVKVLFYDFGSFNGCTPSSYDFIEMGPDEEREVTCTITAPSKPTKQTLRMRVYYTYDLYVNLDNIHVLSEEEYNRERPTTKVEEATVTGPLTMTISASRIPVKAGNPLNMALKLSSSKSGKGTGILEKELPGIKYHVQLLQVQTPEGFTVSYTGPFYQEGNRLSTDNIRLLSGERTITFSLVAPDIQTPRETFHANAVASGFDVFVDDSVDLTVEEFT